MSDEHRWYYGLGPSERDRQYDDERDAQREEQHRAERGICVTCGYWKAADADQQCEACATPRFDPQAARDAAANSAYPNNRGGRDK